MVLNNKEMKILVIGGGNMGLTYAQSFLRSHITRKEDMMILEKSPEKAVELSKKEIKLFITISLSPQCRFNHFAVKPQDAPELFKILKPLIEPQQVFLSIMAGVKISTIQEGLGITKVIRAMPNLPAQNWNNDCIYLYGRSYQDRIGHGSKPSKHNRKNHLCRN
ncbi:MAG: NAD(P)-binding domain-containing protein [Saprospiraceae bacterium]